MDYKDVNDYEMLYSVCEGEYSSYSLYEKYKPLIDKTVKKWCSVVKILGYDEHDLRQEISMLFFQLVDKYDSDMDTKFITLLYSALNIKIKSYLRSVMNLKDWQELSYHNLSDISDEESELLSILSSDFDTYGSCQENEFWRNLELFDYSLSYNASMVFELFLSGYHINEIAYLLGLKSKAVSNHMDRIRKRLREANYFRDSLYYKTSKKNLF